jgi:siroheme synthase (precorrin-2 oxidase/ferrochelatase)
MGYAEDLAIELHEVWYVANSCSDLAEAHDTAATAVSGCSPSSVLNDRADTIGLGTAVADAWVEARDELLAAIKTNASSCRDTSAALKFCIEHFTAEDDAVKTAFDSKKKELPYV